LKPGINFGQHIGSQELNVNVFLTKHDKTLQSATMNILDLYLLQENKFDHYIIFSFQLSNNSSN